MKYLIKTHSILIIVLIALSTACQNVKFSQTNGRISIITSTSSASPSPTLNPLYKNDKYKFAVRFPVKCQEITQDTKPEKVIFGELPAIHFRANCKSDGIFEVNIVMFNAILRKHGKNQKDREEMLPSFSLPFISEPNKFVKEKNLTWQNCPAKIVTVKSSDDNGKPMDLRALLINTGDKVFEVVAATAPNRIDDPYVKNFFDSFKLESALPPAVPITTVEANEGSISKTKLLKYVPDILQLY